jgi:hypothetical protein
LSNHTDRQNDIDGLITTMLKNVKFEDSLDNRIILLDGLIETWSTDGEYTFEKSMYIIAANSLLRRYIRQKTE